MNETEITEMATMLDNLLEAVATKLAENKSYHKATATFCENMVDAYTNAGFSREEAMLLVTSQMRSMNAGGKS